MNKETNINQKMFLLQQEIGAISKDASNPFYKSKYFDINSLIKQLNPLLAKHRILLSQPTQGRKVFSILKCMDSETSDMAWLKVPKEIKDPQKLGSAITYLRRYTLSSLLGLQAVDDDGNLASGLVEEKKWLNKNTPEFSKAIEYLRTGGDILAIKSKYNVSKEIENELTKL